MQLRRCKWLQTHLEQLAQLLIIDYEYVRRAPGTCEERVCVKGCAGYVTWHDARSVIKLLDPLPSPIPLVPVEVVVPAGEDVPPAVAEGAVHDEVHVGLSPGASQVTREHLNLRGRGRGGGRQRASNTKHIHGDPSDPTPLDRTLY